MGKSCETLSEAIQQDGSMGIIHNGVTTTHRERAKPYAPVMTPNSTACNNCNRLPLSPINGNLRSSGWMTEFLHRFPPHHIHKMMEQFL